MNPAFFSDSHVTPLLLRSTRQYPTHILAENIGLQIDHLSDLNSENEVASHV